MTTFTRIVGGTEVTFSDDGHTVTATPEGGTAVIMHHGHIVSIPVKAGEARARLTLTPSAITVVFGAVAYDDKFTETRATALAA